jgi:alpha-amylase/alpha-mannosidase (GH57 family)
MNNIKVRSNLSPEIYRQLQEYMTQQGLSEAAAIEAIVNSYFLDKAEDELVGRIAKIEQALSDVKRHVLAIRFR